MTPAPATRMVSSGRVTVCSRRSYPASSVRVWTPASRQAWNVKLLSSASRVGAAATGRSSETLTTRAGSG